MKSYSIKIFALVLFFPSIAFAQVSVTDIVTDQIDCAVITHNLKLGSRDANTGGDVTTLQTYLSQANFLDSDPTGYLGRATKKAVVNFQMANSISPTGTVGSYTRAKIKELSCNNGSTHADSTTEGGVTQAVTQTPPVVPSNIGSVGGTSVPSSVTSNNPLSVYPESGQAPLTVMIQAPHDVMNKIEKCVYSVGWFGPSGNGLQVDWGDGTNVFDSTTNVNGTSCASAVGKHTYNKEGTYIINAKSWHPGPTDAPVTDWEGKTYVKVVKSPVTTSTTGSPVTTSDIPMIDLKINNSDGPLSLDGGSDVKVTWVTRGVTDCQIMVAGVASTFVPVSGSLPTTINPSWTPYVSLTCKRSNNGETLSDYVKILPLTKTTTSTQAPTTTITTIKPMEQPIYTTATLTTTRGTIEISFDNDKPLTVANFGKLASQKFYDGVRFHRVIKNFMIQTGDPLSKNLSAADAWGTGGPGYKFNDELTGKEEYPYGTVAMANSGANTNGSQFFIVSANPGYPLPPHYTVFGHVTKGLDVVDAIQNMKTSVSDRPLEDIIIEKVEVK